MPFMIDAAVLPRVKPGAVLVNTVRGGLVDHRARLEALKAVAAGLDVCVSESNLDFKDVTEELIALPNVIAAPHAGASIADGCT